MTVSAVSPLAGPSSTTATGSNALGKNEFLKLMIAQMQNQDPTAPTDSTAFVAQLAQFSSLEQLTTVNDTLGSLLISSTSTSQEQAASFVGKNISYKTSTVSFTQGQPASLSGTLASSAASVTEVISDASGKPVRTIKLGATAAGSVNTPWDGLDDKGNAMPSGRYSVNIVAADAQGQAIAVTQQSSGLCSGVSFAHGYPELMIGGDRVPLSAVQQITQPTP